MRIRGKRVWMNRFQFRMIVIGAVLTPLLFLAFMNPTNYAATEPNHADARLRTRVYHAPIDAIQQSVIETIGGLRTYGQQWVYHPSGDTLPLPNGEVTIHAIVPVLIFRDDLVVTLRTDATGDAARHTVVNVTSRSRVGRGDLGENRRHIVQLLSALDQTFSSAK